MALTPTTIIPLGFTAPDFKLYDVVSDKELTLQECKGDKGTVVVFMCNHCPFVILLKEQLVEVANAYQAKGIKFIAINSNDVENYPDDSPEKMKEDAINYKYPFPYLFDETQEVAKAYDAACTPDWNVFDADLKCVYRGQFCDARPSNGIEPTGEDLMKVMDALINGTEVPATQKLSAGCNIKWR